MSSLERLEAVKHILFLENDNNKKRNEQNIYKKLFATTITTTLLLRVPTFFCPHFVQRTSSISRVDAPVDDLIRSNDAVAVRSSSFLFLNFSSKLFI